MISKAEIHIIAVANENARRDQRGATDAGTAVHGHGLAGCESVRETANEVLSLQYRRGNATIRDRKGNELDIRGPAKQRHLTEVQLGDLVRLEEADDKVDALGSPTGDLILEPIARPRTRHDRQPPAFSKIEPVDRWSHQRLSCSYGVVQSAFAVHLRLSRSPRVGGTRCDTADPHEVRTGVRPAGSDPILSPVDVVRRQCRQVDDVAVVGVEVGDLHRMRQAHQHRADQRGAAQLLQHLG